MSEHRLEYIDLCAAWALGSIDPADRQRLEQHLARGCAECEAALQQFGAATVLVAASAGRAAPSPALRERVLAAARAAGGESAGPVAVMPSRPGASRGYEAGRIERRPRPEWMVWAPLALAAALAITSALLSLRVQVLSKTLSTAMGQLDQLQHRLADEEKWSEVLRSPAARVSVLEPTTEGETRLRARATYDPATRRAVVVFENFYNPSDHDYQLWVIRGGAPASLGLIKADTEGHATMRLENVGDSFALSAFAVSLEQKGGSPNPAAPTGPVVMLGKLSG